MILNLLLQEGIDARIDGEFLQGGVGELQAMGVVRVMVNEDNYNKAQTIIDEWESKPAANPVNQAPAKHSSNFGAGLFFGIIIGAGATYWAYNSPVTVDGIDHDHDGQLDERYIYKDNRLSRIEVDRNLDGNMDVISSYNIEGMIHKTISDDNFDGIYEGTTTYERGNALLYEADLNNDEIIDYRSFFDNGVISEIRITGPTSFSPKKKQKYKMNKLISSEFDSDGDGSYDTFYKYDYYEEIR